MGLLLVFLVISGIISVFSYFGSDRNRTAAIIGFAIPAIVLWGIAGAVLMESYFEYVDMKQSLVTIDQYVQEVKLYSSKGVAEFNSTGSSGQAFTDIKFQSYQKELSNKLYRLSNEVTDYNYTYSGKLAYADGWLLMGLIVKPDPDMKLLLMSELCGDL